MTTVNHDPKDVPLHPANEPSYDAVTFYESAPCAGFSKPLSAETQARVALGVKRFLGGMGAQ